MNMCPSNKHIKQQPELCLKGQIFFIFTNYQISEVAKDKISLLGGKVDTFLSKDVTTVLVEDNHLSTAHLLPNDIPLNLPYGPNGVISPNLYYQGNPCNLPSTSRGLNLLLSASCSSPLRVIRYAVQWGIQVLGISQFLSWIDPQVKLAIHQKKKIESVSNLIGCYIKFENCQKIYRPCYKMFNNDPDRLMPLMNANILVKPDTCNVILDKPAGPRELHFNHMNTNDKSVCHLVKLSDKKPQNSNKVRPKEESTYCEICRTRFTDLRQHIKSAKHQSFVSNEKNYESVHNIIKMLPTAQEFIEKHQKPVQNSNLVFMNGDVTDKTAEAPAEMDLSLPLNLQIRKAEDVPLPVNLHLKENDEPLNLHVKRNEESMLPLNLHIKKNDEIKIEPETIKQEDEPYCNIETGKQINGTDIDVIQPKLELPNDEDMSVKIDDKDLGSEGAEILPNEIDPLFDKSNTAALAQLCLKNFDSYWLDVPCDMDDIVFDDNFFDFDDGKQKSSGNEQNEYIDTSVENFVPPPTIAHMPGLIPDASNACLKTQHAVNNSLMLNNSADTKDITVKNEPSILQGDFPSICKIEKDLKEGFSPSNICTLFSDPANDGDKLKLNDPFELKTSVNSFFTEKPNINVPSCSNTVPVKLTEQMFSSDSSDDENGNVLISNVLNIISNSDNEMKVDRDSVEEDLTLNSAKSFNLPQEDADIHNELPASNVMQDEPPAATEKKKIPHKKSVPKLRKMPPLWSVCLLPGSGVKLKFTCIQRATIETIQSDDGESFSD